MSHYVFIYLNNSFNASELYDDHMHRINLKDTETKSVRIMKCPLILQITPEGIYL